MVDLPLTIHVGYPKTATTTFQKFVFSRHPDIHYLGKFIPSYDFVDSGLKNGIDNLIFADKLNYLGAAEIRSKVGTLCAGSARKRALLSTESFIHPSACDLAIVADRAHEAFGPCKVLITIREQISAILSFYWMHGRFGQYLSFGPKEETDRIPYPIPFHEWLRFQKSSPYRNYLATLRYDKVAGYYAEKFGHENVCVLLYENLVMEPENYCSALSAFLGIDPQTTLRLALGKHEYPAEKRNKPWDKGQFADLIRDREQGLCARLKSLAGLKNYSAPFADDMLKELSDMYRDGNRQLENDMKLPLSRFGYCV